MDRSHFGFASFTIRGAMKKDDLEAFVLQAKIDNGIAAGIKIRCYAVWSFVATIAVGVGSWISSHFEPVRIGFEAFWVALWSR